jgi:N-glycosylase/DNA lyase
MQNLLRAIKKLKNTSIKETIDNKIYQFSLFRKAPNDVLFQELCFCLMAANFNAEKSLRIQNTLQEKLITLSEKKLAEKLKELGHRHPNVRAKYIVEARKHIRNLKQVLKSIKDENELREWFAQNVKGLGLKESSHFLRNIGYKNLAIVDFHIVDLLVERQLIDLPKTITPKIYLHVEEILKEIAKPANLSLAELDLYLWYMETGKIIK